MASYENKKLISRKRIAESKHWTVYEELWYRKTGGYETRYMLSGPEGERSASRAQWESVLKADTQGGLPFEGGYGDD